LDPQKNNFFILVFVFFETLKNLIFYILIGIFLDHPKKMPIIFRVETSKKQFFYFKFFDFLNLKKSYVLHFDRHFFGQSQKNADHFSSWNLK